MSIIGAISGNTTNQMSDSTIANDMISSGKSAATMYLNATLESATPELKAIFSGSLNQIVAGHAAISALAVDRKWYKPYESPEQQLADVYKQSVSAIDYNK